MSYTVNVDSGTPTLLYSYRYPLLVSTYLLVSGAFFFRIQRQPYTKSIKIEQCESIFKATTLAAVLVGVGMEGDINRRRSDELRR